MALTPETVNGWVYLTGVTAGNGRALLGPTDLWWRIGPHFLGIQAPYQNPVLVRAYYDPTSDPAPTLRNRAYRYLGYVQFLQFSVRGVKIPPEVFGGTIARLAPYRYGLWGTGGWPCVDFMGPGDARARMPTLGDWPPPMYAFNGMLWGPSNSIAQLSRFGAAAPNGSLYDPTATGPDASRAASLLGQIDTSLITPDVVERHFRRGQLLVDSSMTSAVAASKPLYQHVVEALAISPHVPAEDRAISLDRDITFGRFVGRYLLLNVANYEGMEPVLCATLEDAGAQKRLLVRLIEEDTAQEMDEQGARELFERVRAHDSRSWLSAMPSPRQPDRSRGRGQGRPYAIPAADGETILEIEVANIIYGKTERSGLRGDSRGGIEPISGFRYTLGFAFDAEAGALVHSGFKGPFEQPIVDSHRLALEQYFATVGDFTKEGRVDTSNFDMIGAPWVTPSPTAPTLPRRPIPTP